MNIKDLYNHNLTIDELLVLKKKYGDDKFVKLMQHLLEYRSKQTIALQRSYDKLYKKQKELVALLKTKM